MQEQRSEDYSAAPAGEQTPSNSGGGTQSAQQQAMGQPATGQQSGDDEAEWEDEQSQSVDSEEMMEQFMEEDLEEFQEQMAMINNNNPVPAIQIEGLNQQGLVQHLGKDLYDYITKPGPAEPEKNKSFSKLKGLMKIPKGKKIQPEVCAKVITNKDTIVQCFDCRMDSSCIICLDCFKNGDHEGHKYFVRKGAGGCCDCGDPEAWKPSGFCKAHSGDFKDFEIDENTLNEFAGTIKGMFYLYFNRIIKRPAGYMKYHEMLCGLLLELNENNTWFNKLTTLCFNQKLSPDYTLNAELDSRTILENLLTTQVTGEWFKDWHQLMITMFSYYPLKLLILTHYINNYGLVMDGSSEGLNNSLSISCQIVTSYKVLDQYCKENNKGIGHGYKPPSSIQKMRNYIKGMLNDFNMINKLSEGVPFTYWSMHIRAKESVRNILEYYDILIKKARSEQAQSETELIVQFMKFTETELTVIEVFMDIIATVSKEPQLIERMIKVLWHKIAKQSTETPNLLCIFRPYERILALCLHAYFNYDLSDITHKRERLVNTILKTSESQFLHTCNSILNKILYTLFFYPRTQAQPGLGQTMYIYIYLYKTYNKILSNCDLLAVKIFLLLSGAQPKLTFESIISLEHQKLQEESYRKEKSTYLINIVKIVRCLYVHFLPEMYLANTINPTSLSYPAQTKQFLLSFFKEHGFTLSQKDLATNLLHCMTSQSKCLDQWIQQNCNVNKENKQYSLNTELREQAGPGLNYSDFWINLTAKDPYLDIAKTLPLIRSYNVHVAGLLWNQVTLQSLGKVMEALFPTHGSKKEELAEILPVLVTLYLMSKQGTFNGDGQMVEDILQKYNSYMPGAKLKELGLLGSHVHIESPEEGKNEKINQLKAKKLQKMKEKQQFFIETAKNNEVDLPLEKQQKMMDEQLKEELSCCICKNQINQNSVIIANLTVRNHQKLLQMGTGNDCVCFDSCNHIFDHKCISKMYSSKDYINNVTCPLCKYRGNLLYPASLKCSQQLQLQVQKRLVEILCQLNKNVRITEQLLKAFYQYVLMCLVDLQRTVEKKALMYKVLLRMVREKITQAEITEIESRLASKSTSKRFPVLMRSLSKPEGAQQAQILQFFTGLAQGELIQRLQSDIVESPLQPKAESTLEEPQDSELFFQTCRSILRYLSASDLPEQAQSSTAGQVLSKYAAFVDICLKTLLDQQYSAEEAVSANPLAGESLRVLIEMPSKYTQVGSNKKCSECGEVSMKAVLCLLCSWRGCQSETCEAGFTDIHNPRHHGQVGAYMVIQKGDVYYWADEGLSLAGCLYENEWGKRLKRTEEWDSFELNKKLYLQIEKNLLLDTIPKRKPFLQR